MPGHYNVLFLCTTNCARSIMAEAIMNKKGFPTFTAYSAGTHPRGVVHAAALRQLEVAGLPVTGLRSKSWNEFLKPEAPQLNFVEGLARAAPFSRESNPQRPRSLPGESESSGRISARDFSLELRLPARCSMIDFKTGAAQKSRPSSEV